MRRLKNGRRLGDIDLIPVLMFMLSDGARVITGQIINVDGGIVMSR